MGSLLHQSENFCISNSTEAKLKLCARASKTITDYAVSIDLLVCTVCLGFFLGLRKYILHKAPKGLKQRSLRLMFDDKCSRPEGMLSISFSHEQRND